MGVTFIPGTCPLSHYIENSSRVESIEIEIKYDSRSHTGTKHKTMGESPPYKGESVT